MKTPLGNYPSLQPTLEQKVFFAVPVDGGQDFVFFGTQPDVASHTAPVLVVCNWRTSLHA